MSSAVAVVACALSLLGRSEKTFPPITLVEAPPKHASIQADAFVSLPNPHIYVVTSSPTFLDAMASRSSCSEPATMKKLASILAHEEWHVLHGSDESGAVLRATDDPAPSWRASRQQRVQERPAFDAGSAQET